MGTAAVSLTSDTNPTEDSEEPGSKRRATRAALRKAYTLRYNRLAAWVSLANALIWALLLVRNWIVPADPTQILYLEAALRGLAANLPTGLVPLALFSFVIINCVLAWLLYRGARFGKLLAVGHAAFAVAACAIYYVGTKDFGPAFFLALFQGVIVVVLSKKVGLILVYPGAVWLIIFFVVPLFSIVAFSLGRGTAIGTVDLSTVTLDNYQRILQPVGVSGMVYVTVIARTVWVGFLTTVICIVAGYPFAFWMAHQPPQLRNVLMLLVMIPFWTNLLIRTYAWVIILRRDGLVNNVLMNILGITSQPLDMMNTPGALMLGLIYGYLPYMILPLYTAIERLDPKMVEAASDLYAQPWQAFYRVVLPLTMPGIIAGSILVFIPSVGTYVISNLLGGGRFYLIGNLLEQQFSSSTGDKAFGAAFGVVLTVMMLVATLIYFRLGGKGAYAA